MKLAFGSSEAFGPRGEENVLATELWRSGRKAHETAVEKGFWPETKYRNAETYIAKMMLLVSEVSEVMEAFRKEQGAERIAEEMADIYVRWIDLYEGMREDGLLTTDDGDVLAIGEIITEKMEKNASRPVKHGNLL